MNKKVRRHFELCRQLNETYERKNHDYRDSFHKSYLEEGLAMARIRLGDKYNRFCALSRRGAEQKVDDESFIDTLLDMANYAIMTIMEIERSESENGVMELSERSEDGVERRCCDRRELDEDGATAGLRLELESIDPHDPSAWSYPHDEVRTVFAFGSGSPHDSAQGLSGESGDSIGRYKKISLDDIVEAYRRALDEANERTMSALDRVIAAGKESFGAFKAEIGEEEDDAGFMEDPN